MHSIKAIWWVETEERCTPPPAASNASGSPKAARDADRGGWMGGGFGAGKSCHSGKHRAGHRRKSGGITDMLKGKGTQLRFSPNSLIGLRFDPVFCWHH